MLDIIFEILDTRWFISQRKSIDKNLLEAFYKNLNVEPYDNIESLKEIKVNEISSYWHWF